MSSEPKSSVFLAYHYPSEDSYEQEELFVCRTQDEIVRYVADLNDAIKRMHAAVAAFSKMLPIPPMPPLGDKGAWQAWLEKDRKRRDVIDKWIADNVATSDDGQLFEKLLGYKFEKSVFTSDSEIEWIEVRMVTD